MEKLLDSKVIAFSDKPAVVYPDDEASSVAGKRGDFFVVSEKRDFLGMILEGTLLAAPSTEKARNLSFNPPILSPESTVFGALKLFASAGMQLLPIVDKGKLVGSLSIYSLLEKLDFSGISLEEVSGSNPYSVLESAPVADIREIMVRNRLQRAYVTDTEGHLVGIVTHGSFLQKPSFFKKDWRRAAEIMEHSVLSVSPTDTVKKAVDKIVKHRIRAIAVSDAGKLAGSVEVGALLSKYIERLQPAGEGIKIEVSGLNDLESFERAAIDSAVFLNIRKISRSLGPATVKVVFKKSKTHWEVKLSAKPVKGKAIILEGDGYDPLSAASQVLRMLERKVRHD